MSEAINKLWDEMEEKMDAQAQLLWLARDLLCDLSEHLADQVDVRDGSDGEQRPNAAMQFVERIDEWLGRHKKLEVLE